MTPLVTDELWTLVAPLLPKREDTRTWGAPGLTTAPSSRAS